MTIALWCVLVAALLPFCFTMTAKAGGRFTPRANHKPREFLEAIQGWPKRAHWAQQNSFEAFPMFAAAAIIAHVVAGPNSTANLLALLFIACRIFYGLCYLLDWATIRSLAWFGGIVCVIGLFVVAA